jgi:hypothetical protein
MFQPSPAKVICEAAASSARWSLVASGIKLDLDTATVQRPNGGRSLSGRSIKPGWEKRSAFRQDVAEGCPLEVAHRAHYFIAKSFDIE